MAVSGSLSPRRPVSPPVALRREPWLTATLILVPLAAFLTAWYTGRWQGASGDYGSDYAPAMHALLGGHVSAFFAALPVNGAGGSILLRAPAAGVARLLGGGPLELYRAGSLLCLLALGAIGVVVARDRRSAGASPLSCLALVAVFAAAPALLEAVFLGHPEEPLGAALAIAAVLAAPRRPAVAGALLGAAIITKPWGLFALGPVLLAARSPRTALAGVLAVLGPWLGLAAALAPGHLGATLGLSAVAIPAHPQDMWWPFSRPDGLFRQPPGIVAAHARQLAVIAALAAAALLAVRSRRVGRPLAVTDSLALLAFGFALRCLLEPSTHDYYQLPLLCSLAAWELWRRRTVTWSLLAAVGLAVAFGRPAAIPDWTACALYLTIVLPLVLVLGRAALLEPLAAPAAVPAPTYPRGRCRPGSLASSR